MGKSAICWTGHGLIRSIWRSGRPGPRIPSALLERLNGRSIVIVGMMASGKSRLGRILSERSRLPFHDLDTAIEEAASQTVADIFERYGESEFRRLEDQIFSRLLNGRQSVLALGGGAWLSPSIREACKGRALSIWLDVPIDILVQRASRTKKRPLLFGAEPALAIRTMLDSRRGIYALADVRIRAGGGIDQTLDQVIQALQVIHI